MFCGTLAAHGGVRPADNFEFELDDPVLKRKTGTATSYTTCLCSDRNRSRLYADEQTASRIS